MNNTNIETSLNKQAIEARLVERFKENGSSIIFSIREDNTLNDAQWKFLDALSRARPNPGFINVCSLPTGSGKSLMECLLPYLFASNDYYNVLVVDPTVLLAQQLSTSFKDEHDMKLNKQFLLQRKMPGIGLCDFLPSTLRIYDRVGASKGGNSMEHFKQNFNKKVMDENFRVMFANIHQAEILVDFLKADGNAFQFTHIVIDEGHHIDESRFGAVINHFRNAEVFLFTATEFKIRWTKPILANRNHGIFVKYRMSEAVNKKILKKPVLLVKKFEQTDEVKLCLQDQAFGGLSNHKKSWQSVLYSPTYIRAMANEMLLCLKKQMKDNPTARAVCKVDGIEHCIRVYREVKKLIDDSPDPDVKNFISMPYYSGMRSKSEERNGFSLSEEERINFSDRMKQYLNKTSDEHPYSVLIQPRLCSEGYDDPYITTVVFFSMSSSMSEFVQLCGRGTRFPFGKFDPNNRLCYILIPDFFTDLIDYFDKWSKDDEIYNIARLSEDEDLIEDGAGDKDRESQMLSATLESEDSNQMVVNEDSTSQSFEVKSDNGNWQSDGFGSNNNNNNTMNNTNVMPQREDNKSEEEESDSENKSQSRKERRTSGNSNVERTLTNIHPSSDAIQYKFFSESEDNEVELQVLRKVVGETAVALLDTIDYSPNNNNVSPQQQAKAKNESSKRKRDSLDKDENPSPTKKQKLPKNSENLPKNVDAWRNCLVYHSCDKEKKFPGRLTAIDLNKNSTFKITFEGQTNISPNKFVSAVASKLGISQKQASANAGYERFKAVYGAQEIPLDELKTFLSRPQGA